MFAKVALQSLTVGAKKLSEKEPGLRTITDGSAASTPDYFFSWSASGLCVFLHVPGGQMLMQILCCRSEISC